MKERIITLIGTNHKFSDQTIRGRLSFRENEIEIYLKKLRLIKGVREVMILSTCNRVEILLVSDFNIDDSILNFLSEYSKIDINNLSNIVYIKHSTDVVRHMFRVAAGLDSMVIGEPQILGQLKEAYKWSVEFMSSGSTINRIMRRTFHSAKIIRSRTDIAKGAISVAYAALLKVKQIVDLNSKKVLIVGVGEINRLAAEHFSKAEAKISIIANRTIDKAQSFADTYSAKAIKIEDIKKEIGNVDIIITSTASKEPILLKEYIPLNKKLIIVDMAMPQDTEKEIENLENVKLILLDDLKGIVENSKHSRIKQASIAEKLIDKEVEAYKEYVDSLDYDEVARQLRYTAERVRNIEVAKFRKKYADNLNDEIIEGVDNLTKSLLNKVLHEPTNNIRLFAEHPEGDMYIELLKRIFKIEVSKKEVKCFFSENS